MGPSTHQAAIESHKCARQTGLIEATTVRARLEHDEPTRPEALRCRFFIWAKDGSPDKSEIDEDVSIF